ncbi:MULTISPECIES: glycoside hydrolase family 28 protein [unclassified Butyrivibrio]|uniref:glycoside hydrolase family 28 protein n=1 Tax=unclassified Butyrivibrio TaxID=2639466 RepID=UPI0003B7A009|nr:MULTISPECIES: glycoside hydrolase family 28 protein [unclassified Butyrivibrio]MDC7293617.1 glycoside hydrolase family 28 protein [Butyrivibrio sp. DSM 10294]
MDFKVVKVFNRSVTIELDSDKIFCQDQNFEVYINNDKKLESDRNVVTVAGLLPDTEYEIKVVMNGEETVHTFTTKYESVLLDVTAFGAKGDGVTCDTAAIQAAICSCPKDGTVYLPKGVYYSTPVFLKSDMTFWLDEGAVLLGDTDRNHYPMLPGMTLSTDEKSEYNLSSWEGNPLTSYASLVTAIDAENLDIIGPGTIDGNAGNSDWWVNAKVKRGAWRPNDLYLCRCKNVNVQNVRIQNSPCWTVHPYYSDDLSFLNLYIHNPSDSPNTDGLDPESCSNVLVLGTVISVGDDCMAIKSGKYYMALEHHKETDNILIRNCKFERGHGSVTVGSEAAGGVRNVRVSQCIFDGTDRGLRIKTRRGRGERSILDDILFENIDMTGVFMPFTVNMFYFCDPDGHSDYVQNQAPAPVDEMTPIIGSITGRNMKCKGVSACVLCAVGLPERPIGKLTFENVEVEFLPEAERTPVRPVMMDNFDEMSGRSIYAKNVDNLVVNNMTIVGSVDTAPELINVSKAELTELQYR